MITATIVAICGFAVWLFSIYKQVMSVKKDQEIKEIKNEAEKIVTKKTAGDLLNDINKRYPSDSDGKK